MNDSSALSYTRITLAVTVAALCAVAAFVGSVDPYMLYSDADRPRDEVLRPKQVFAKPLQLLTRRADTLIMGSSRVLQGIDPSHLESGDRTYYNFAVRGQRLESAAARIRYAHMWTDVREIYLGVDIQLFSDAPGRTVDFDAAIRRPEYALNSTGAAFLSYDAVTDALIVRDAPSDQQLWNWEGFRRRRDKDEWAKKLKQLGLRAPEFNNYGHDKSFAALDAVCKLCRDLEIPLTLFSQPIAEVAVERYKEIGIWDDFGVLSVEIHRIAESHGARYVDLGGYVDPSPVHALPRAYFFSPAYYRSFVGDVMLQELGLELAAPYRETLDEKWAAAAEGRIVR